MAKAIATINLKGGVGKSTMTAAIAEFMAGAFGKRVLLVDLDPQTNLTTMMIGSKTWHDLNESGRTLKALFEQALDSQAPAFDIEGALQRNVSPLANLGGIDLLASSLDMIEISEEMAAWQYDEPDSLEPFLVLKTAVDTVRDQYDYILIDCPPNMGIVTRNGLMLADAYVIPTIPDVLSTYGIPQIQKRVRMFSHKTKHNIKPLGLIITKYRKSTNLHRDTIQRLQDAVLDYDAMPAHERELTERPPNVIPFWIPDAIAIAAAADYFDFGTLNKRYGGGTTVSALQDLTSHVMMNVEIYT
ncbi:chromosome partitioning protein [Rhodococcus sp. 06-221-2]|uniref:ParA family protein n=1 Tax=Rhodococcus sp. 06-221-2 TaxID=2022514 RepID=UPI000B9A3B53|nr:AAA family ATPase [Rhodococcus sp. 06-221-2]OZD03561.1 chromosome partitioning protein [Rhodococcus sp. 06-221-2]